MKKKSNVVIDMLMVLVIVVIFGIVGMIGFQVFTDMKDDVKEDLQLEEADDVIDNLDTRYPATIDGLIMIVFVGLWIAGIVSAIMSNEHPAIFGFLMFLIVFVLIAGMMLGNFYEEFFEDDDYNTMPAQFPVTNWLLTHMLQIGIIVVSTILLAMLGKNKVG